MTILELTAFILPEGWYLTCLTCLGEADWQAIVSDDEFVAVATGPSPEDAIYRAGEKGEAGDVTGRLFHYRRLNEPKLAQMLGLPQSKVERRI